ncbi:hypothetical protein QBC46DRAFT_359395 [Diplogelasinospora grovesii]|uniref:Uncharacterized protein n=1 Tax=Diplogelasinospora grovesii TaxID=303347 RepID=A0AAN6RXV8_9PEZI|nr:hypothetical protein QBC46DRAFT_359395 [Diplogelasinospora grovesii]
MFFFRCGEIWSLWLGDTIANTDDEQGTWTVCYFHKRNIPIDNLADVQHNTGIITGAVVSKGWMGDKNECQHLEGVVVPDPPRTKASNTAFMCLALAEEAARTSGKSLDTIYDWTVEDAKMHVKHLYKVAIEQLA